AREANVVVQDKIFAETLRTDIMLAIQDGTYQVSPQEWANGHLIKRLVSWLAYGLVRGFLGMIGHSKEQ
ncbi:MAG TPA: cardiolipin synthase ClsB, partial [Methylotenera sp.]|nr:cardiolipin synthase ClsB [Methylotenera sp.]